MLLVYTYHLLCDLQLNLLACDYSDLNFASFIHIRTGSSQEDTLPIVRVFFVSFIHICTDFSEAREGGGGQDEECTDTV